MNPASKSPAFLLILSGYIANGKALLFLSPFTSPHTCRSPPSDLRIPTSTSTNSHPLKAATLKPPNSSSLVYQLHSWPGTPC